MAEIHELPDDQLIALMKGIPRAENEAQFSAFLDDYAAAELIAAELMSGGEWEINESEVLRRVKSAIKTKAQELQRDLPGFDTLEEPINTLEELDAYAPFFTDFYNYVADALEMQGRKIV